MGGAALPELLIFDLDDTLYAEADFVLSGYRAVAEVVWRDHHVDIEPELRRRFNSGQRGDLFTAALRDFNVGFGAEYVRDVLVPAYRQHLPRITPHTETVDVLTKLRAVGHRIALLSDGWAPVQRRKLDALGLASMFDAVVFTAEIGIDAWKPSAQGFELILENFKIGANNAAYIADNPLKDFIAPNMLGMHSFRVIRPGSEHGSVVARLRSHDAQWKIESLADLTEHLEQ